MENAYRWIINLRKDYSQHSDIWNLRSRWDDVCDDLLDQMNTGSYTFDLLRQCRFDDGTVSLWSSLDMIALKLIAQALQRKMAGVIPKVCHHIKGHGGMKLAVQNTQTALTDHQFVMRSDI